MNINIKDEALVGFNEPARDELKKSTTNFVDRLIKESNRLESQDKVDGREPEVTSKNVYDANLYVTRRAVTNKRSLWSRILAALAALLTLLVSIMYDADKLQDGTYMLIFIIVASVTLLVLTLSVFAE
ncbi:hypothetical protein [Cobetia sp. 5-25-4-2]|uniref:hypothetical protein n=1 Tax=Cobetia sp. 5-25-4-2 TaxID=2737459 RepID=UPI0015965682|nr:hypothetical protein [Cobetia sp. 5-25-4-2]